MDNFFDPYISVYTTEDNMDDLQNGVSTSGSDSGPMPLRGRAGNEATFNNSGGDRSHHPTTKRAHPHFRLQKQKH
jgi:hypothetical protein